MTQGFDDYWKNECLGVTYDYPSESARDAYEAGQQSRQAEIDELQKRIDEALSALWGAKSKAAPDGWILAPKEPNEKQKRTAMFITAQNGNAIDAYKGMIADLEVSTQ